MARVITREFALYSVASAGAFAVDLAVLYLLIQLLDAHYLTLVTASYSAGCILAYLLCVRFVFRFRRVQNSRAEFATFWSIGVIGLVINAAVVALGVEVFQLHLLIAKVGAAAVTCAMNFVLRKLLLFTPPQTVVAPTHSGDIVP